MGLKSHRLNCFKCGFGHGTRFIRQRRMADYAGHMFGVSTTVFTIGHSSRPLDAFLALMDESHIQCVVDVRRLPGSRSFPQYNGDALAVSLTAHRINYWHLKALCGRRSKGELHGAPPEDFWTNASFARYAAGIARRSRRDWMSCCNARAASVAC